MKSRSRTPKEKRTIGAFFQKITSFFESKKRSKKFSFERSINLLFVFFVLVAFLLVHRLYDLQVVRGFDYSEQVSGLYSNVVNNREFARGNIYFTYKDGERLLVATNREYYTLVINNRNMQDSDQAFSKLSGVMDIDQIRWRSIIAKKNDPYEILIKRLTHDQFKAIKELGIRGVELHANKERFYPAGDLGSNIIGFISYQGDDLKGSYGLEKYYDNILRRDGAVEKKSLFYSLFSSEEESTENHTSIEKHIEKEGSLISNIEPNVQRYLERELDNISQKYKSEYSAGIVLDPDSLEIVAMGVSDNFDINKQVKHFRNYPIEDRRELGSIIKPLTVAIGLDSDTINMNFSYNDKGSMKIGKYTINNFDKKARGEYTSLQEILTKSLNIGVAVIALDVGFEVFTDYMTRLGFNTETGIDLPFEVYGLMNNLDSRRTVELATASFGQGIAPTALETARAFATLANGGVLKTPYVVDMIEYGDLIPSKNVPLGNEEQIFSQSTANNVTSMLVNIVDDSETFGKYSLPQHSVAIKTGTAQIAKPQGGYYEKQFLHSFVGFFPALAEPNEKQFLVLLYTLRPQGARYSSTTLKDPFFNITEYLINYYGLKPDRNISVLDNIE